MPSVYSKYRWIDNWLFFSSDRSLSTCIFLYCFLTKWRMKIEWLEFTNTKYRPDPTTNLTRVYFRGLLWVNSGSTFLKNLRPLGVYFWFTCILFLGSSLRSKCESDPPLTYRLRFPVVGYSKYTCGVFFLIGVYYLCPLWI